MSDIIALPTVDTQRLRLAISSDPQDYLPSRDDYLFKRIPVYGEVDLSFKDDELYLRVEKIIHETSHSTVFLSNINGFSVVVKCCEEGKFFNDFRKEANVYQRRPPDSAVLVIREGYMRLDGWCSRAHVSSRMVSRASELVNLLLIQ